MTGRDPATLRAVADELTKNAARLERDAVEIDWDHIEQFSCRERAAFARSWARKLRARATRAEGRKR